jgi:hypothetical protein
MAARRRAWLMPALPVEMSRPNFRNFGLSFSARVRTKMAQEGAGGPSLPGRALRILGLFAQVWCRSAHGRDPTKASLPARESKGWPLSFHRARGQMEYGNYWILPYPRRAVPACPAGLIPSAVVTCRTRDRHAIRAECGRVQETRIAAKQRFLLQILAIAPLWLVLRNGALIAKTLVWLLSRCK